MSFIQVINTLKTEIEGNSVLQQYCQSKWNEQLTAQIVYQHRIEVDLKSLPKVMITRPAIRERSMTSSGWQGKHLVRVYFGFYQKDYKKGLIEQVGFEELMEETILGSTAFDEMVEDMEILESANDEGTKHPSYFTVMDIEVLYKRPFIDASTLDAFIKYHGEWDMAPKDGQIDATDEVTLEQ